VPHCKYQESTSNQALSRLHTSVAKKDNNKGNVHTNITLTCICLTTLGVQKQELLNIRVYVCSLSCPRYYVWPVWINHIFPHYLINGMIFGKKLLNIKCVSIFSTSFSDTFLILRIQHGIIMHGHTSSCKTPIILVRFYIFS